MGEARPELVRRWLRRPIMWTAITLAAAALILGLATLAGQSAQREWDDHGVESSGQVAEDWDGSPEVPVRYTHPMTHQELTASAVVVERSRLPDGPGAAVTVVADERDPGRIRFAGDALPNLTEGVLYLLAALAVPLVAVVGRRWSVRRFERLASGPSITFVMLGAVVPPRRWLGLRCELHLWPLDAAVGTPSLCRLPLVATGGLPIGGHAFEVDVKGSPRPLGTVATRVRGTGATIWSVARGALGGPRPRPASISDPQSPPPSVALPYPSGPRAAPLLAMPLAGFSIALAIFVFPAVIVASHKPTADAIARDGAAVLATAQGPAPATSGLIGGAVALEYADTAGVIHQGAAPVDNVEDFESGRIYPARVDPEAADRLRLDAAPYDAVEPLVWAGLPALAAALIVGNRLWVFRRLRQFRRVESWVPLALWPARTGGREPLIDPSSSGALASVRLTASSRARLRRGSALVVPVWAAGALEPHGIVALRADDELAGVPFRASGRGLPEARSTAPPAPPPPPSAPS